MRLRVENLEARETPATFAYDGSTLTVTAGQGETILVDVAPDAPAGYLIVSDGVNDFNSLDAGSGPVTNLVVNLSKSTLGGAILLADASIGGNLTVLGARDTSTLVVAGDVGKNVTYLGSAADESVILETTAEIGGRLSMAMGGGTNYAYLNGGKVHGDLLYRGGGGADNVDLTEDGNLAVDGSATFKLGAGDDILKTDGDGTFRVGGDLRANLGAGTDFFNLNDGMDQTDLEVGGDFRLQAGDGGGDYNEMAFSRIDIGGDLAVAGGVDNDVINASLGGSVGGAMTMALGDGNNQAFLDLIEVGGSMTYLGGVGEDSFTANRFQVGRNLVVASGESIGLSGAANEYSRVYGSMKLTSGPQHAEVRLGYINVAGNLAIKTGAAADDVLIDDINVTGTTTIGLGGGTDLLAIDDVPAYVGVTTFGGALVVKGGGGADQVQLAVDGTKILFGSSATFIGGGDTDLLNNSANNDFFGPTGVEDFESGNGVVLA